MAALAINCSAVFCREAMGIIALPREPHMSSRGSSPRGHCASFRGLFQQRLAGPDDGELYGLVGDVELAALLSRSGKRRCRKVALAREILAVMRSTAVL